MKSIRKKGVILAVMLCFIAGTAVSAFAEEADVEMQPNATVGSFVIEHLDDLSHEIVNNVTEMGLEAINEQTEDGVSETLLLLLGGSTGRTLGEIKDGIEETQDMILELQASLNEFRSETEQSLKQIEQELYRQNLQDRTKVLDDCNSKLEHLNDLYSNIVSQLYKNDGTLKTSLAPEDWNRIEAFMNDLNGSYDPSVILTDINSIVSASASEPLYDVQMKCLTASTSLRHKTYMDMYYMVNYVTQLRTTALNFQKEKMVYAQMKAYCSEHGYASVQACYNDSEGVYGGFKQFEPDYSDYFKVYYNPAIEATNNELSKTSVFSEMKDVFEPMQQYLPEIPNEGSYATEAEWNNAVSDYMAQYIDVLKEAIDKSILTEIEVYDPDGKRVTEDAYKVVSNKDNQVYYISLAGHTLSEYLHHTEWEDFNGVVFTPKDRTSIDYGHGISTDGRYLLPSTASDISNLMSSSTSNQLSYLMEELKDKDGKCKLNSDWKIILTTKTEAGDEKDMHFYETLWLLDSRNYSTIDPQYIMYENTNDNGTHLINSSDVHDGYYTYGGLYQFTGDDEKTKVKDAKLLMIYTEQGLSNLTPNTGSDLPSGFNLKDGQTLDLSKLSGSLDRKITVTGDVTIDGGGNSFKNLQIYLCEGADLTLKDISITGSSRILYAYGRDVSLTASGEVNLTTTDTKEPIYAYNQCDKLSVYTAEGAVFNVTGEGLQDESAAIHAQNALNIEDAAITINSSTNTAIYCGKNSVISGAKLNCDTKVEGNGEITMGSGSIVENSTLDLTWGGISGDVTLKNNTWTGKARIKAEIKTGSIDNANTDERVDLTLYNGSESVKLDDISKIDGDQFEKGHTDTFYFSIDPKFIDNDAMTLQMHGDDGWFVEYAKVYDLSGSDKVNTYNFYCWLDNDGSWKAHQGDVASTLVVKTANEDLAGTASDIKVSIKYIDNSGNTKTTETKNMTKFISNGQFDAGDTDTITLVYPELREDSVKEILGFYVTSDHSGSNAGWKLQSMEFYLDKGSSTAPKMIATGLDQWFLEANKTCYFGKNWSESGSCTITTKTANKSNAGTDSYVYLSIVNQDGVETEGFNFTLYCQKRDYDPMEKGKTDKFNIAYDEAVGNGISKIIVNSTGSGAGPTWECEYIEIVLRGNDGSTSRTYRFSVNKKIGKGIYEFTPDGMNTVSLTPKNHYSVDELKAMLEAVKDSLHVTAKEPAILSQELLTYLKNTGKSLTLEHCDEDGNVLYQWIFRGEDMDEIDSDVDLRINFITEGFKDLYGENPANPAVALQFNHKGAFPEGTSIRFNSKRFGFKAGAAAYPYTFDSAASKLILQEEGVQVNSDGTVSLAVTDGSDILVTGTKLADGEGVDNSSVEENNDNANKSDKVPSNHGQEPESTVATGDEVPAFLWLSILLCMLSAGAIVVVLRKRRKE